MILNPSQLNTVVTIICLSLTNSWCHFPHLFPLSGGFLELIQPGEVDQLSLRYHTSLHHWPTPNGKGVIFILKKKLISCFDKDLLNLSTVEGFHPHCVFPLCTSSCASPSLTGRLSALSEARIEITCLSPFVPRTHLEPKWGPQIFRKIWPIKWKVNPPKKRSDGF